MANTNVLVVFNEFFLPRTVVPSNIGLLTNISNIFITKNEYFTTILNSAGGISLVATSIGPLLGLKGLVGGSYVSLVSTDSNITINYSSIVLNSLGGMTLVGNSVGPALSIRGLVAGNGISIVSSDTTLRINSTPTSTDYAKFVASAIGASVTFPVGYTELNITWKKLTSDSTSTIVNTPSTFRIYNQSGSTKVFRVDADLSVNGIVTGTAYTLGMFAQGETIGGDEFTYQQTNPNTASAYFHIARNMTLTNGQYFSLYGMASASDAVQLQLGCSITINNLN